MNSVYILSMVSGISLIAGCSSYKDPTIVVTGATLTETTDEAVAVNFGLNMHNPNDEALTLIDFKYDLSIDGKPVFHGVRAAETVLAIQGDKHVQIPGVIRFDKTGWLPGNLPASAAYHIRGHLQYITPGKIVQILFDTGVRKPTADFAGSGEVSLAATPATSTAAAR